jgi:hypothetical protein
MSSATEQKTTPAPAPESEANEASGTGADRKLDAREQRRQAARGAGKKDQGKGEASKRPPGEMPTKAEMAKEREEATKRKEERAKVERTPRVEVPDAERRILDASTAQLRQVGGEKWGAMRLVELEAMRQALKRKALAEGFAKHRPLLRRVAFGDEKLTGAENNEPREFLRDLHATMVELAQKAKPKPWTCKTAGIRLVVLLTVDADGVTKDGKAKQPATGRKAPKKAAAKATPPKKETPPEPEKVEAVDLEVPESTPAEPEKVAGEPAGDVERDEHGEPITDAVVVTDEQV